MFPGKVIPRPTGINVKCLCKCELFQCSQRAIQWQGDSVWCTLFEDYCIGPDCKYAMCKANRLLTSSLCGFTVKKLTSFSETKPEEVVTAFKAPGKLQHRLGDRELY